MAILEFEFKGIDQNFRSSVANVLKDIDKIKSAFSGIGGGSVDVSGLKKGMDEVRASIKLAESDNKMFLATKLADTRQASIEELNAIRSAETQKQQAYRTTGEAWKAQREQEKNIGVGLDNSFKETRNSISKLNEEQKRYNATQRETRDALKNTVYPTDSIVGMRTRLNELRTVYDRLSESQRNSGRVQSNLVGEINILNTAVSRAEQSTGRFQRNVGNYQQAQSGANGVAMEFNRIIQDAPFGMMGIGNNIQQLASNWQVYTQQAKEAAAANGTTVTSMSLVKGAMASMMSTGNLITLGIAAITSAWTFYTMQQQKANKATKDNRSEMDKLRDSLSSFQKVQLNGVNNYAQEIAKLQTLYKVATNASESTKARTNSLRQLQEMYPKVFSNLDLDTIKTDKVSYKYKELSSSIIAAARAQAAFTKMSELSGDDFTLISKGIDNQKNYYDALAKKNALQKEWNKLQKENPSAGTANYYIQAIDRQNEIMKSSVKTAKEINRDRINIGKEQERYSTYSGAQQEDIVDLTGNEGKGLEKSTANTTKNLKEAYDYLYQIRDLINGKQKDIDLINVDGQAKDLIELEHKWEGYFNKIADLNNKLQKDIKNKSISSTEAEKVKEGLRIASGMGDDLVLSEQSEILKKYQDIRLEIIRKSNEEAGIFEQQSRETDLAKQKIWLDEKLKELVKNGAQIKQAMEDMLPADLMRTYNINIKWDDKELEEWGKLNDKIQETIDKPFSGQNPKSIQDELEKRIGILKKLLEQLAKATGQPFDQAEFDKMSKEMKDNANNQKDDKKLEKDIQDYTNILKTGVDNVFTNLKSNIDEFGWKAESVFYTLGETVGDMLSQMSNKGVSNFMDSLTTISENGKTQWQNMDSSQKKNSAIGAGLGMLGRAFTDLTPKTSSGGQAIGGALTGAAAGVKIGSAVPGIGTAVGAAAGAVVGGVSGLLKAAKNKRQEKIIQEQLEEQKKANRLLERMSALTYASQIIGQKTEYGIVSGVRRNEFGQIVSVVQGQDIIMVADRTNKQKQR